jgi:hypothetical protein
LTFGGIALCFKSAGTGAAARDSAQPQVVTIKGDVLRNRATDTRPWFCAPDRPFAAPAQVPSVLKVSDTLMMKCVVLPPGRFLQGSPFYQRRYQDEFPHSPA